MSQPVDVLFNASSRHFETKFSIFFEEDSPIEVTDNDYIIDWHLQESVWDNSTILGGPVAASLDLTLSNVDGRFTPKNLEGPYAEKIRPGIKIQGFLRVIVGDKSSVWYSLGTFYVFDWKAPSGTATAEVYAKDRMDSLLSSKQVAVEMVEGSTYAEFIRQYFTLLGFTTKVIGSPSDVLPYAWVSGDVATTVKDLLNADMLVANCLRTEDIQVESLLTSRNIKERISDSTGCIISVDDGNSLIRSYGASAVYFYDPTFIPDEEILAMTDVPLVKGTNTLGPYTAQKIPIAFVDSVMAQTEDISVKISSFHYTPETITLIVVADAACKTELKVKGTVVQFNETASFANDPSEDTLVFQNKYVQSAEQAVRIQKALNDFFDFTAPLVTVETIGNMSYQLLDHIIVDSKSSRVYFDGIIVGIETEYSGSLSQTITLMSYDLYKAMKDIFFEIRDGDLWVTYNEKE